MNQNEKPTAETAGAALVRAGGRGAENPTDRGHYGLLGGPGESIPAKYCYNTCSDNTVRPGSRWIVVQAVRTGYRGNEGMNVQTTKLDGHSPL